MFASRPASRSVGVAWLEPGHARRRRRGLRLGPVLALVAVLGVAAGAYAIVRTLEGKGSEQRDAVARFAAAWARGDIRAMWRLLTPQAQSQYPRATFRSSYRAADRAATLRSIRAGKVSGPHDGRVSVPVTARTRDFGTLRATMAFPVEVRDGKARIAWSPELRLPGVRPGEGIRRRVHQHPRQASVLAADGHRLADSASSAAIAAGLAKLYRARLNGRPGEELLFGHRVVARVPVRPGKPVHATIRPGLQATATSALGGRLGGVAVIRPRTGDVLALAGLAVSAPQPPGSTFKIITLSAALTARIARPSSTYPIRTYAVLDGVKLRNASDEACGGTLVNAFAVSCNSVFAPLGARLGARRLVRMAERFGFNQRLKIPAARPSTIPRKLGDSLAVGASAIGQDKDLATPLGMASVAATIGEHGVRARPRIVRSVPVVRHRAVSSRVARQVRTMMIGVVRGGTGTAAQIPGVEVAGKTGTAELRSTVGGPSDPKNTDAWFVAFAPASRPKYAVGVMLVGAGAGGAAAAPIARQVLAAALGA